MSARPFDLATLGNYTKDTIVRAGQAIQVDGGGFNYAAHAGATLGLRVAAVTRLAEEDTRVLATLEERGIRTFAELTPSSTLMRLEYPTANVDERELTVAATAGSFTVAQVEGVDARSFVVSPSIRGEVPIDVLEELHRREATIGLDVQGYVRIRLPDGRLEHSDWPEMADVLRLVDVLKADAVEAEALTGESELAPAARALAAMGPSEVLLTHRGGLLLLADGEFHTAEFLPNHLVGRSGRGDTCLGSYVGSRLSREPAAASRWAAAVTSLKLEAEGPVQRTHREVEEFVASRYEITS